MLGKVMVGPLHGAVATDRPEHRRGAASRSDDEEARGIDELAYDQQFHAAGPHRHDQHPVDDGFRHGLARSQYPPVGVRELREVDRRALAHLGHSALLAVGSLPSVGTKHACRY